MTGYIKTYFNDKGFGFIKGENNEDYFFHMSYFKEALTEDKNMLNKAVSFKENTTKKGLQAIDIILSLKTHEINTYLVPDEVYVSSSSKIKRWETVYMHPSIIKTSSRSPQEARDRLIKIAKASSANAILNMNRFTTTESELATDVFGIPRFFRTHKYTMHHFTGNIANIGKKDIKGSRTREELLKFKNGHITTPIKNYSQDSSYVFLKFIGIVFIIMLIYKAFIFFLS